MHLNVISDDELWGLVVSPSAKAGGNDRILMRVQNADSETEIRLTPQTAMTLAKSLMSLSLQLTSGGGLATEPER